ncbi:MAG: PEPxxWA-CTERM sorting domain-containing protein [Caulobacterales bacterium]
MSLRQILAASAVTAATLLGASAQAATLLNDTSAPVQRADDTSFNTTFDSLGAGLANLAFTINGFGSLDGRNYYEDDFTLALNGSAIFSGTFNLGGGGSDAVFLADPGATVNNVSGNGTAITWTGGRVNVATPLTLAAGANTLTFGYHSLEAGHAGAQALGDETWGASNIVVTQTADSGSQSGSDAVDVAGVPEPASWALMLMGFGGMGALLRRRRPRAVAA